MSVDVIVIGGGTSGMMAAVSAAEKGARVMIIDKNKMLGKKLRLTGGGRCNVTNNRPPEEIISFIPGNGKFLYSTFSQFNNYDIMEFFESHGVHLKEEDHGRMFPVANTSKAIVNGLFDRLTELNVELKMKTTVKKLLVTDGNITGVITDTKEKINAPCVVLATGGKTYQYTGSTGDGYTLAKKVGHTITKLFPTESPLLSDESFIQSRELQGLSLRDIGLSVLDDKGKVVVTHEMDALFTHSGISGPAALRCSMFVNQLLEKGQKNVTMSLDLFPLKSDEDIKHQIISIQKEDGNKSIKNALKPLMQERYLEFLLVRCGIDTQTPFKQVTEKEIDALVGEIKHLTFTVNKTYPLDKSFVTGGGVSLKEVNPKTMESKCVNGLFFCGELLDINGYTGGFNITAAFCTGHVAGEHAAEIASYFNY